MNRILQNFVIYSLLFCLAGTVSARSLPDFTPLVEKNSAAVVNISTSKKNTQNENAMRNMPEIPEDSPFFDFFNKYFG